MTFFLHRRLRFFFFFLLSSSKRTSLPSLRFHCTPKEERKKLWKFSFAQSENLNEFIILIRWAKQIFNSMQIQQKRIYREWRRKRRKKKKKKTSANFKYHLIYYLQLIFNGRTIPNAPKQAKLEDSFSMYKIHYTIYTILRRFFFFYSFAEPKHFIVIINWPIGMCCEFSYILYHSSSSIRNALFFFFFFLSLLAAATHTLTHFCCHRHFKMFNRKFAGDTQFETKHTWSIHNLYSSLWWWKSFLFILEMRSYIKDRRTSSHCNHHFRLHDTSEMAREQERKKKYSMKKSIIKMLKEFAKNDKREMKRRRKKKRCFCTMVNKC